MNARCQGWWLLTLLCLAPVGCRTLLPPAACPLPTECVIPPAPVCLPEAISTSFVEPAVDSEAALADGAPRAAEARGSGGPATGPAGSPGNSSDLEPIPVPAPLGESATAPLELREVVASVYSFFPPLRAAQEERRIADGKATSAWGEFDLGVELYHMAAPEGYYQNYRSGATLYQPTCGGGFLYGGYRIGDGDFPVWYKEWLTDEGGQFKVGWGVPLAKNRAIDSRRAGVAQTALARQAVEPAIQAQLLAFVRDASDAYWSWVAAGRIVNAQEELLRLAQDRAAQIEARIRAGDLEEISRIDNQRLIATRETKLIESQRKLQAAAIKLSLFLRDEQGQLLIPADDHLPPAFPDHSAPDLEGLEQDVRTALAARPELQELDLIRRHVQVELDYARNQLLPKVDAKLEASKDVGGWAERTGDKTPLELEAGLFGEVPLQRREARGKIQAASGKLAQLAAKREFVANKVEAEVRDAVSALATAHDRIERSRVNLDMAHRSLDLGRQAFGLGDITVVTLNLYEQATLEAELLLIEAQADYFKALAAYRAALALDPFAQRE